MKKKSVKNKTYSSNNVLTMFESLKGEIKLVVEGQQHSREETYRQIEGLRKEMKDDFIGVNANLKAVFDYMSKMEDEIMEIKAGIKKIGGAKTNKGDLQNAEKRILKMEKEMEKMWSIIQSLAKGSKISVKV